MQNQHADIIINGTPVKIGNLVDLHAHWPLIRHRLQDAIESDEIGDTELCKIIEWLVVLGEKTLFRID